MRIGQLQINSHLYLFVLFFGASVVEQPTPPPLLERALPQLPGVRLLEPTVDLVGYTVDELKSFGYWPPWITTDVDRDGLSDVVSVVVKPGATRQFGVIAVHARDTRSIQWVTTLGERPIYGVAGWPTRDTVMPLFCVECDSNAWYRWSGRAYEAELYAVGERIAVATFEGDSRLGLFARATRDSKFLFPVKPCTEAIVRRVAGSKAERWYFIETQGRDRLRGWIPASFASESECIG